MSDIFERFLMDLTESKKSKELFLRIIGFEEGDLEETIAKYEKKSMSLMDMFIEQLEREAKCIPEIKTIGVVPLEDEEEFLEEDMVIVPREVLTELLLHQKYTNDYLKYYLKLHEPTGYEVCVRQLNHMNKEISSFSVENDIDLEE